MAPYLNLLSIVVISKNEEEKIGKCLNLVMKAIDNADQEVEVVLVDSCSSDKTVEVSKEFPIKILQLKPDWTHSPAAGRYIGFLNSHGKYVQFLDGDMVINEDWLPQALNFLEENSDVAAVSGELAQTETNSLMLKKFYEDVSNTEKGELCGSSLFRSSALEDVASFDPYLVSVEEGELKDRLLSRGYEIKKLPLLAARHLVDKDTGIWYDVKKEIKLMIGEGQVLRRALFDKEIFLDRACHHKFYFLSSVLLPSFVFSILGNLFNFGDLSWVFISTLGLFLLFSGVLYAEKGKPLYSLGSFLTSLLLWPFFVYGFLKPVKEIGEYPKKPEVIK